MKTGDTVKHGPTGEWQPIETAPKDNLLFLAVDSAGRIVIWAGHLLAVAMAPNTPAHLQFRATHWMPLPKSPGANDAAEPTDKEIIRDLLAALIDAESWMSNVCEEHGCSSADHAKIERARAAIKKAEERG